MKSKMPTNRRRMAVSKYLWNQAGGGAQINFVSFEPYSIMLKQLVARLGGAFLYQFFIK